ncbi:hypothetical protein ACFV9P_00355 [Streptomyces sp. NPDC059892]|uniref:hypothetical protein n=1 Tax=Streptomyces sp. NPDC059892 TaxID=3346989 RepID=UPI00364AEE63
MRWTLDDVIGAAFTTLEAEGLDGLTLRGVARTPGSHFNFTLGLTQEQQTPSDNPRGSFDDLVATGGYPALARIGEHLMVTDSFDNRFHYGLSRLLLPKS